MKVIVSSEVQENIFLSQTNPSEYSLADTFDMPCVTCSVNSLTIFAKDKNFTQYTCSECGK